MKKENERKYVDEKILDSALWEDRECLYLLEKMIEQVENSTSQWKQESTGRKSLDNKAGQLCDRKHLQSDVLSAAEKMESAGIFTIKWSKGYKGFEFVALTYQLEDMPLFYEVYRRYVDEEFQPRWYWTQKYQLLLRQELDACKTPWIRAYYTELYTASMKKGQQKEKTGERLGRKWRKEYDTLQERCPLFRGLDVQKEPVFKRLFSKKYLGSSKKFENIYQSYVIAQARRFCTDVDEEMDNTTVLSQIFIEEYAQELSIKGPLEVEMKTEEGELRRVSTKNWIYGATFNSEMLKRTQILSKQPDLKRIITIENKANFVSVPYRKDTLYIFSHGYFAPKEKEFLKKLYTILKNEKIIYLHSGDLDYGGIKIFQNIKEKVFPKLQPVYMDTEVFERYREYAEPLEKQKLEKIRKLKEPLLQPLIDKIAATGLGIEQESFLLKGEYDL